MNTTDLDPQYCNLLYDRDEILKKMRYKYLVNIKIIDKQLKRIEYVKKLKINKTSLIDNDDGQTITIKN